MLTTILSVALPIAAAVPPIVAAYVKLREVLHPLLSRRALRVGIVVCEDTGMSSATAFAASLRKGGFREVAITRDAASCLDRAAIVLWQPTIEAAPTTLAHAQSIAPEATVMVMTYLFIAGLRLGERVMLANSTRRLLSDLAAVAETA